MIIEQTVTIPTDHRVFFEFLAPKEIPPGLAKVVLRVIPVSKGQSICVPENVNDKATPLTDALSGILAHVGDISLEEIRAERLEKYLK